MKYRNIFKPTFIASIITLATIGFTLVTTSVKAQLDERPNVVMIVLDDMSYSDLDFYGGEIETPTLSSLADEGVLFTNFHAGSICSPSRAMFNTGVDNHRAGMGTMLETMTDNQLNRPGYEGYLNDRVVTTATLLKDAGYHTYMVGKWHLGGAEGPNAGRLPGQRGFERNFAVLDGAGDFYSNRGISSKSQCVKYVEDDQPLEQLPENAPFYQCTESPLTAVRDQRIIDLENMPDPEQGDFYATEYFTRKIVDYLDEDKDDGKPFFAFVSYTTPHYPLQVPSEWTDQEGNLHTIQDDVELYMKGWDVLREERFQKMKDMGIVTADELPPAWPAVLDPNDETAIITVDKWNSLNKEKQLQEATERAVYAGMLKYMDDQVQRIINKLKELGKYENTMIIFFSDNGGDAHDKDAEESFINWFNQVGIDNDNLDNLGGPLSWLTVSPGWTQLGMTPFWGEKATQTEGGTRAAFFVHYPKLNINQQNINHAFVSVLDLTPTILDYADIEHPGINYKGHFVFPMDGKSMRPIWEGWQTDIYRDNEPIGFEVKGHANDNKSLYLGDYKIVTQVPPWGDGTWKLFNLAEDPAEQVDLSAQEPEKMAEMLAMYEEFEADVGFVPAGALDESFEPTPQTFKRPDSRLTLHADNVDNVPELKGVYEGVTFQRNEYVSSFKAGGEITAHVVWGQDENGEEILYAFKTEEEVLTNLNKITAKNLKKNTIKDISSFPMVYDGILFRPDEYKAYFDQGLNIDMYLALEQRYGYPVVHAFLDKKDLVEFYQTAQDKRCAGVLGANVKEKTDSPLEVEVYLSSPTGTYVTTTMIKSENEAILVGGQNLLSEGKNVAEWVKQSGKQLKAIWITHAHPNRYFGVQGILDEFPNVPVYTTSGVVQEARETAPEFLGNEKTLRGDDEIPDEPIVPEPYDRNYLVLEGQCIEIMPFSKVDSSNNYAILHIPSTKTLIVGDIATRGVHALAAGTFAPFSTWFDTIDMLEAMKPAQVITGHTMPESKDDFAPSVFEKTRTYLKTLNQITATETTAAGARKLLEESYPALKLSGILDINIKSHYAGDDGKSGEGTSSNGDNGPTTSSCTAEDNASPLEVEVYLSSPKGTYVTSTLIKGEKEAILVGGQNLLSEGRNVAKWAQESGKTVRAIWVSHAHPNRYFGVAGMLEVLGNDVPVYTTSGVLEEAKKTAPEFLANEKKLRGDDEIPDDPMMPQAYDEDALALEGNCIEIMKFSQVDSSDNYAILHIPSLETLFVGDIATRGVHALASGAYAPFTTWLETIETLKAMNPKQVITGHTMPESKDDFSPSVFDDATEYLTTLNNITETNQTAEEARLALMTAYPTLKLSGILDINLKSHYQGASGACTDDEDASPLEFDVYSDEIGNFSISMLIKGENEAILVGGQTALNGKEIADWVKQSGKTLTTIWVTHAHFNRYLGLEAILDEIPNAVVYSTAGVAQEVEKTGVGIKTNPEGNPPKLIVPETYNQASMKLEGNCINILPFKNIDGVENYAALHIPSLETVFVGDIVDRQSHMVLLKKFAPFDEGLAAIEALKEMNPKQVVVGHAPLGLETNFDPGVLDDGLDYIEYFKSVVETETTQEGAIAKMTEGQYADYIDTNILSFMIPAYFPDANSGAKKK